MIAAIIQARMGSTRLPGKVLKKVLGKTLLEHLISRVKRAKTPDKIIVATTTNKEDAPVAKLAQSLGVGVYRGSEDDVLDRYYRAAKEVKADTIVRLTGDCPVIDPNVIDRVVSFHEKNRRRFDYVSNVNPPTFPDGFDVEVFSFTVLKKTWQKAKNISEREHVTPFMRAGGFRTTNVKNEIDISGLRLTVDEKRDLVLIKKLIGFFAKQGKSVFGLKDIIALWREHPDFFSGNQDIKRNEGYRKSLKKDAPDATLQQDQEITLRRATARDARFLYNLRNEETVRKASFRTNPVSWEDHIQWLQKKLAGNDSVIFIVKIGDISIGQIRFDSRGDTSADINIAISKKYRGKGYGSKAIQSASKQFFAVSPSARGIRAHIKENNTSSCRAFEAAGYRRIGKRRVHGVPCVEMFLGAY